MKRGIRITKVWCDDDLVELRIEVSDGVSHFSNKVYVGQSGLVETVSNLNAFKDHFYGGLLDVRFGEFGSEYANGAFHARFHFPSPGRLYVTCRQESDFVQFSTKTVASKATMYVESEPGLLDRFIAELGFLVSDAGQEAYLEGI